MEENTSTLDIRAMKIERERLYRPDMEMNKVIVGQKHIERIIDWTLGQDIFIRRCSGLAKL
jgi:hypothetical protein